MYKALTGKKILSSLYIVPCNVFPLAFFKFLIVIDHYFVKFHDFCSMIFFITKILSFNV